MNHCEQSLVKEEKVFRVYPLIKQKYYYSHYYCWNKWDSWCNKHKIDTLLRVLKWLHDFLADLFVKGYKYMSVCSHRSATSAFYIVTEEKNIESTCRLAH